jgi:hypothetical protein
MTDNHVSNDDDDKTPITPDDVAYATNQINRNHPLSRLELSEVMPWFAIFMKCCCCCIVKNRQERIEIEKREIQENNKE